MNEVQEYKQEIINIDKIVVKLEMFKMFNHVNETSRLSDRSESVENFIMKQIEDFAHNNDEYNNDLHSICGLISIVGVNDTIDSLIGYYKRKRFNICEDILKRV